MGKCVKTLVVKQRASWAIMGSGVALDKEANRVIREIERANEILGVGDMVGMRTGQRGRTPLERTRNRCVRELKHLFAAYLSGDYNRDDDSAVTLGQIEVIGGILEAESPSLAHDL